MQSYNSGAAKRARSLNFRFLAVILSGKKKQNSNDNLTNMHDSIYSSLSSFSAGLVSWAGETLLALLGVICMATGQLMHYIPFNQDLVTEYC